MRLYYFVILDAVMTTALYVILTSCFSGTGDYESLEQYAVTEVRGWKVRVNHRLIEQKPQLHADTLQRLDVKLHEIQQVLPKSALDRIAHVPLWVELDNDHIYPCICYHVSARWLEANGFHPEKEGSIEICNAEAFLQWSVGQPWIVLHELAHAYHHQHLGHDEKRLLAAYQKAVVSTKYASVLRYNGSRERHYGLKSVREYFAEATEAYFGVNDYFPFDRAELRRHDPKMYRLLQDVWGEPDRN